MAKIDDHLLDVNEFGVLRIPAHLWLALVFQARNWVIGLVAVVSAMLSPDAMRVLSRDFSWHLLALELPALLALWACTRRRPEAGNVVRRIWPWVRHLIVLSVVLHLVYLAWFLAVSPYWLPWPELFLVSCALFDVATALGVARSPVVHQVLTEFPAETESSKK